MKTLITPAEAIALAFADGEYIAPEAVTEADIAAAEARYIVPVTGRRLHARLLEGAYADFTEEYLAAPTALYTRLQLQPAIDIRTGQYGSVVPKTDLFQPADGERLRSLRNALRTKARTLLRRASDRLDESAKSFPEYDPDCNILKRCSIEGDFVRTL